MDLFSLVAKLTLDAKDYEKAIQKAENEGKHAHVDAQGTISVQDHYSAAVRQIQQTADGTNLDAHGEATLGTADYKTDAKDLKDNTDVNATGEADLNTTKYEAAADEAKGVNIDNQGEADLATEGYIDEAEEIRDTDIDAHGDAELETEDYISKANSARDNADLDVSGEAELLIDGYESDVADLKDSDINIVGEATLNKEAYDKGINEAKEDAKELDGILKGLKVAGITAGIGKVLGWIGGAISDTATYADTVDKASRRFNISTRSYQEWSHALSQSGADIQSLQRGLLNMNKAVTGGEVSEEVADAFAALGINPQEYRNNREQLLTDTIMRLADLGATDQRDALVTAIFGRNGTELNALLDSGVDGINDLIQEASDLGLIMSDEDIQAGVEYGDTMANLEAATNAIKMELTSSILPALTEILNFVIGILRWVRGDKEAEYEQALQDQGFHRTEDKNTEDTAENWNHFVDNVNALAGIDIKATDPLIDTLLHRSDPYAWSRAFGLKDPSFHGFDVTKEITEGIYDAMQKGNYFDYYRGMYEMRVFADELKANNYDYDAAREVARQRRAELDMGPNPTEFIRQLIDLETEQAELGDITNVRVIDDTENARNNISEIKTRLEQIEGEHVVIVTIRSNGSLPNIFQGGITGPTGAPNAAGVAGGIRIARPRGGAVLAGGYTMMGAEGAGDDFVHPGRHAKGMFDVPYDDYAALLHRDEMVLTASQAREYREGDSDNSLIAQAISELRTDMQNLKIIVGEKTFGRTVVQYGGRRLNDYIGGAEDRLTAGYGW